MASWYTATARPSRDPATRKWTNSIYYQRVDSLPLMAGSVSAMAQTASAHAASGHPTAIRLKPWGTDDWLDTGNYPSSYFVDKWPSGGTPPASGYTTWALNLAGGDSSWPATHRGLYFADLRQEAAHAYGIFGPIGGAGYFPASVLDPTTDKHAVLWSEPSNELLEAIGYSGTSADAQNMVMWDLSSYTLPRTAANVPAGVVAARIPFAPLLFTHADVVAATGSGDGDLGHMLGWVATNYKNTYQWPARLGDGELPNGLPCGSVIRLRPDFDVAGLANEKLRVIARTLQRYGAVLYDKNYNDAVIGMPNDPDWPQGGADLGTLLGNALQFTDFQWVDVSSLMVSADSILASGGTTAASGSIEVVNTVDPYNENPLYVRSAATVTGWSGSDYHWTQDWGDGAGPEVWSYNPDRSALNHTYAYPGTYTITTCAVADSLPASGSLCFSESVTLTGQAVIVTGVGYSGCAPDSPFRLVYGPSNNPPYYIGSLLRTDWNFGDGTTDYTLGSTNDILKTYSSAGAYTVSVTGNFGSGYTETTSFVLNVAACTPASGGGGGGTGTCIVAVNDLTEYGLAGEVYAYYFGGTWPVSATSMVWDFGDGTPPVATTATVGTSHTYTVSGTYTVSLVVTHPASGDTATCSAEISVVVPRCADNGERPLPLSLPVAATPATEARPRRTLGTGHYEVYLLERGGEQVAALTNVTDLSWTRTLDDTSSASVTCISEEWADLIHPWMHEVSIVRNGEQVWVGPVRDKEINMGTSEIVLSCRDLSSWFDKRLVHDELDVSEMDMCDYAEQVIQSAMRPDPSPNIQIDKSSSGKPIDRYIDPETPRVAGEEIRELASSGIDFTVIGRTIYLRGDKFDDKAIQSLLGEHFLQLPVVKESGNMATWLVATGQGGDIYTYPQTQPSADQWELHPYGLLEQVFDASAAFDSDDSNAVPAATKSRFDIVGQPILYITDGVLHKDAPVKISELVPGRRIDVRMDVGGVALLEQYRLQGVSVKVSDTQEDVSVTLTALGATEIGL